MFYVKNYQNLYTLRKKFTLKCWKLSIIQHNTTSKKTVLYLFTILKTKTAPWTNIVKNM